MGLKTLPVYWSGNEIIAYYLWQMDGNSTTDITFWEAKATDEETVLGLNFAK